MCIRDRADDLGYAELGSYGQTKIETPNIDALAKNGMRFTQHYTSSPVCAPARCMFCLLYTSIQKSVNTINSFLFSTFRKNLHKLD